MMRLRSLIDELREFLDDPMLIIEPGPDDPNTATHFVKITRGPGLGLTAELAFDQYVYDVEVAGRQGDYDSAEDLAHKVDRFFLRFESQSVDGIRVLPGGRGGGPSVLLIDDAKRWHFVCSYTLHVESALTA